MSIDLIIQAKREIIRVKSGVRETQMTTVSLRDPFLKFETKKKILSEINFEDQLEIYLKYWEKEGESNISSRWIIYDFLEEDAKIFEEEFIITDMVFKDSPDYQAIIDECDLYYADGYPLAYVREKPYKDTLLQRVKNLQSEDYDLLIVGI